MVRLATLRVRRGAKCGSVLTRTGSQRSTITATQIIAGVEKTATCIVTVSQPVVDIEISPTEVQIVKAKTKLSTLEDKTKAKVRAEINNVKYHRAHKKNNPRAIVRLKNSYYWLI